MRKLSVLFGFCTIAAIVAPAAAEDGLTPLLGYVPHGAVVEGVQAPVAYVDLAAIRAVGVESIPLLERFSWSPMERELAGLSRVWTMPPMLQDYMQSWASHEFATTRDYLGFAWSDIGQAIGFGNPPDSVAVMVGTPAIVDAGAIGAALTGRGFAAEDRGGSPFWWRYEDNRVNVEDRDPADPLRGHLGGSARAGIVDGAFVATASWPSVDRLLAARAADLTLAASADFTAMAHALDQPVTAEGSLLQAYLMAGAFDLDLATSLLTGRVDEEMLAELRARLTDEGGGPRTPRYRAVAIADRQEGNQAVGVVALVYASAEDAELATRTVPEAVATLESLATRQPFRELLPFEVTTSVVAAPDGARHVAVIGFPTTLPPRTAPAEVLPTAYRQLVQMMFRADMGPFVPAD